MSQTRGHGGDPNPADYKRDHYFDRFYPSFVPPDSSVRPERWFVFCGRRMLVKKAGGRPEIPTKADFDGCPTDFRGKQHLGEADGFSCYGLEAPAAESPAPGMSFEEIRPLAACEGGDELFRMAGFAFHIMNWSRLNAFCGRCGAPMTEKGDERARLCPQCGSVVYPRISPATITAIIRGDEILLAHNNSFCNDRYSLIAGFVEPGETAEDCVRREIFEEVKLRVKNLRYFGSQPWPFPDSLMLAFTAEYDGGEIQADGVEIGRAAWFRRGSLPRIPGVESVAGRMIRWFEQGCR